MVHSKFVKDFLDFAKHFGGLLRLILCFFLIIRITVVSIIAFSVLLVPFVVIIENLSVGFWTHINCSELLLLHLLIEKRGTWHIRLLG